MWSELILWNSERTWNEMIEVSIYNSLVISVEEKLVLNVVLSSTSPAKFSNLALFILQILQIHTTIKWGWKWFAMISNLEPQLTIYQQYARMAAMAKGTSPKQRKASNSGRCSGRRGSGLMNRRSGFVILKFVLPFHSQLAEYLNQSKWHLTVSLYLL